MSSELDNVIFKGLSKQNIDIQKCLTPIENAICKNPSLLELDSELDKKYQKLYNSVPGDLKPIVRNIQQNWLKDRDRYAQCYNYEWSFIEGSYKRQIANLVYFLSATKDSNELTLKEFDEINKIYMEPSASYANVEDITRFENYFMVKNQLGDCSCKARMQEEDSQYYAVNISSKVVERMLPGVLQEVKEEVIRLKDFLIVTGTGKEKGILIAIYPDASRPSGVKAEVLLDIFPWQSRKMQKSGKECSQGEMMNSEKLIFIDSLEVNENKESTIIDLKIFKNDCGYGFIDQSSRDIVKNPSVFKVRLTFKDGKISKKMTN